MAKSKKPPDISYISYENLLRTKTVYYSLLGFAVFFICIAFVFAVGAKSYNGNNGTIPLISSISSIMFFVSLGMEAVVAFYAVKAERRYEYLKTRICPRCGTTPNGK